MAKTNKAPKSKRQRSQQGEPRKAKAAAKAPAVTKSKSAPASFVAGQLEPMPIKQTGSWQLVAPSVRLWFQNYNTCIVILLLPSLLVLLGALLAPDLAKVNSKTLLGVILMTVALLWQLLNVPVVYYLQTRVIRGDRPGVWESYRQGLRYIFRLAGLFALVTLLVFGGILLLVVPGIIVIRRYLMAPFYMIDQDLGIRESMRRSAADSKPVSPYIWGVYGVYFAIIFMNIILFSRIFPPFGSVIGAFISSLFVFGPALRYKEIALRQPAVEPEEA